MLEVPLRAVTAAEEEEEEDISVYMYTNDQQARCRVYYVYGW